MSLFKHPIFPRLQQPSTLFFQACDHNVHLVMLAQGGRFLGRINHQYCILQYIMFYTIRFQRCLKWQNQLPLHTTIFSTYISYKNGQLELPSHTSHNLCNNMDAAQLHRGRRTHQRQDPPYRPTSFIMQDNALAAGNYTLNLRLHPWV